MVIWNWRAFNELSLTELYEVLALRQEVFTTEQNCTETDLDFHDQNALHLLGYKNNQLVAYLRLLRAGSLYPDAISFGRVVVKKEMRKQKIAHQMLEKMFDLLKQEQNQFPLIISAQMYLENFYKSYGFESVGTPYDEGGILHIKMKKYGDACQKKS